MNKLADLVAKKRVVICVGSGGVGKTTTSAIIALQEAKRGRRVIVLTIDPAKRLANALGLESFTGSAQKVELEMEGELWAMMLDMKACFDEVVQTYAPPEARDEILTNRIYKYFSTSLAGTQEYAASERLYQLYESGEYDLIVLDTPPTTHALDFLDAPNRLGDAVNSRALQWLYKPTVFAGRKGMGVFSMGTSYVVRILSKLTGAQLLDEFSVFLQAFSTLFDGLQERGKAVRELLSRDESTFIVVSIPDPLTLKEAAFFYDKLGKDKNTVGAFVINRVHDFGLEEEELDRPVVNISTKLDAGLDNPRSTAKKLLANARQYSVLKEADANALNALRSEIPGYVPIVFLPYFDRDIHNAEGLERARYELFDKEKRV